MKGRQSDSTDSKVPQKHTQSVGKNKKKCDNLAKLDIKLANVPPNSETITSEVSTGQKSCVIYPFPASQHLALQKSVLGKTPGVR